jgi:5-methylthioadenosine/S-adenosylhomocysteine deaminase
MPGFVNCHSHLEITVMRGFLDEFDDDFSSWLIKLTKTRADKLNDTDIEVSSMLGAFEGVRAGVTCFGDIGRWGKAGLNALKENGLRGVLFQETEFSPDNETAIEDFEKLKEKFLELKSKETELVKVGISPHAPYTVSQKLFESIADYAISNEIKTTIHAAESLEEQNLMQNGIGFFAEIYEKQNINWQTPKKSTIEYLSNIGVLDSKPLLAHCVKVSANDIKLIAESGAKIAHCPKSNAKFGHGIAPFESFLDKSIAVGFGSDSMASNNTCDILEESRFATLLARTRNENKRFIHAKEIIETATLGGAKALGLEKEIGTLEEDKQADLIIISLETVAQMPVHDVCSALLFATNSCNLQMTMVAGEEIFRYGISKKIDEQELKAKIEEITEKMN